MPMNIQQAKAETKRLFKSGQCVIWSSGSGIGKSQSAWALFEDLRNEGAAKGETWGCGITFAATLTPPDVLGIMWKGERQIATGIGADGQPTIETITVTDPACPLWFISTEGKPAFCYDKFFLIIDEYGQGEPDVKRALAEVGLNGGAGKWRLPPGSPRLFCTNEGARYGVSKDFDFAIARRSRIEIAGDIEPLLNFMDKPYIYQGTQWQTMPVTKAWAAANPTIVFETEPEKQGPWCNPRQLCAADRYLQIAFADKNTAELDSAMLEVTAGTIGHPAAVSYSSHMAFRLQLPSYDDVVKDPTNTPVPQRADLQMLMAYELASYSKPQDLGALITYIQQLPKDMGVTYISALLRRDYKSFMGQPAMQAWVNKNASLVSIIASLAN